MNNFSRRNFLFASSGAAAGTMLVSGLPEAEAADGIDFSASGLVTGKLKPLRHKSIPAFLSADQIAPHHTAHYGGALRWYPPQHSAVLCASSRHFIGRLARIQSILLESRLP